jgi:hypothetical protein
MFSPCECNEEQRQVCLQLGDKVAGYGGAIRDEGAQQLRDHPLHPSVWPRSERFLGGVARRLL